MKPVVEGVRFVVRVVMTPIFVVSFGVVAIIWLLVLFPLFALFAFIQKAPYSYGELAGEAWECFKEPLKSMRMPKAK